MAEDNERVRERPVARRRFLRAASLAAGTGLAAGRAGATGGSLDWQATDGQSLYTGVHTSSASLSGRPLVVYGRPESDERTICTASVSWRHRAVVPLRPDGTGETIYTDLYTVERFPAGTVLRLVDRLSACPRAEGTLILLERVASPDEE